VALTVEQLGPGLAGGWRIPSGRRRSTAVETATFRARAFDDGFAAFGNRRGGVRRRLYGVVEIRQRVPGRGCKPAIESTLASKNWKATFHGGHFSLHFGVSRKGGRKSFHCVRALGAVYSGNHSERCPRQVVQWHGAFYREVAGRGQLRDSCESVRPEAALCQYTMQRRPTVLLIEENAAVRDALEQAFEGEDFLVVPAVTSGDALSEQRPYDVALIDVSTVRRNGFETFRKLNQLKPLLPIILISSQPELLNHPAAARASARMLKPLEIPLLCRTVRDLTVGSPNGREFQPERCP